MGLLMCPVRLTGEEGVCWDVTWIMVWEKHLLLHPEHEHHVI